MLTNNYKKWVNCILNGGDLYNGTNINGDTAQVKFGNSADRTIIEYFGAYTFEEVSTAQRTSILVGTGQREERPEDFALESIVPDSELTANGANATFVTNQFFFTKTLTYIGANDITINEVALIKGYAYGQSICLARQKIEPLTVKTGDVFTVTMVIG